LRNARPYWTPPLCDGVWLDSLAQCPHAGLGVLTTNKFLRGDGRQCHGGYHGRHVRLRDRRDRCATRAYSSTLAPATRPRLAAAAEQSTLCLRAMCAAAAGLSKWLRARQRTAIVARTLWDVFLHRARRVGVACIVYLHEVSTMRAAHPGAVVRAGRKPETRLRLRPQVPGSPQGASVSIQAPQVPRLYSPRRARVDDRFAGGDSWGRAGGRRQSLSASLWGHDSWIRPRAAVGEWMPRLAPRGRRMWRCRRGIPRCARGEAHSVTMHVGGFSRPARIGVHGRARRVVSVSLCVYGTDRCDARRQGTHTASCSRPKRDCLELDEC